MDSSSSHRPHLPAPGSRSDRALRLTLAALVIGTPFAVAYALTAAQGLDLFHALPLWNDESWWYLQYGAMSEYGRPLGYFGYMGSHAAVGTFASWGAFAVMPVGLLARVFGWGLHAFIYYNFLFLALADLAFILLTRPTRRSLVMLAVTNALLYINICYSVTAMNETSRYAMAIVLAGLAYRMLAVPEPGRVERVLRVTAAPLFIAFATCFDLVLGIFIPVYLFLLLRRQPLRLRAPITAVVSLAALYALLRLKDLTCAATAPEGASFAVPGLRFAVMRAFFSALGKLQMVDPLTILSKLIAGESMPIYLWFCLLIYITAGVLLWRVAAEWRAGDRSQMARNGLCLFVLAGCWGGLVVEMYEGMTEWTFIRHCNAGVCCAMMLAALAPRGKTHAWRTMAVICLAGAVTFLTVFTGTFSTGGRFSSDAQDQAWAAERQTLSEVIALDPDASDPWANTVTPYHLTADQYYCVPYGAGINTSMADPSAQQSRYALLGSAYGDMAQRQQDVEGLSAAGYELVFEDEQFAVLVNRSRTYG